MVKAELPDSLDSPQVYRYFTTSIFERNILIFHKYISISVFEITISVFYKYMRCQCSKQVHQYNLNEALYKYSESVSRTVRLFCFHWDKFWTTFHLRMWDVAVVKMMLYFGSVVLPAESAFPRADDSDHFHDDFPLPAILK